MSSHQIFHFYIFLFQVSSTFSHNNSSFSLLQVLPFLPRLSLLLFIIFNCFSLKLFISHLSSPDLVLLFLHISLYSKFIPYPLLSHSCFHFFVFYRKACSLVDVNHSLLISPMFSLLGLLAEGVQSKGCACVKIIEFSRLNC